MPSIYSISSTVQWLQPKNDESNLISACFHMLSITLISMSLVHLTWFEIISDLYLPDLSIGQFFWFGYIEADYSAYAFVTRNIANIMRITILLCFMAIIFNLLGFFLDIIGTRTLIYRILKRYGVPGTCTVLWLMTIIGISYYVVVLLEDSLRHFHPDAQISVSYGAGFYVLTGAGGISLMGVFYNLVLAHNTVTYYRDNDDRCILEDVDDLDTFNSPTPPPPYNVPPPPYTP